MKLAIRYLFLLSILTGGATNASAVQIQSGLWSIVDEQGAGSGIQIIVQRQLVGVIITTYNEAGEATWFSGIATSVADTSRLDIRLLTARNGRFIADPFTPADVVDTGLDAIIQFDGAASGSFTLNGVTKGIRLLRFAGGNVTIPGEADPRFIKDIPELTGEWALVMRRPNVPTQTRVLKLQRLSDPSNIADAPDAPVVYMHQDNPLNRVFLFCEVQSFSAIRLRLPLCFIRIHDSERITEFEVPTENIAPDRFDARIISLIEPPNSIPPEVFAVRLGDNRE